MSERRKILDLYRRGDAVALGTLVHVEGSSYRRIGARILITATGDYAGSISGGCLEAEVVRKAQWLTRNGAVIERYSTLFDDTAEIPYGLGCGGTVDLLLEPAGTTELTALMQALEASLHGESRRIVTQLPAPGRPLRRCILAADGTHLFSSKAGTVDPDLPFFDEQLDPPQRLIVFGAGDDAQPLVSMASLIGWNVTVVDGRPQWARPERFPQAERVLAIAAQAMMLSAGQTPAHSATALKGAGFSPSDHSPGEAGALAPEGPKFHSLHITPNDAVVVMTHSYEQDRAWLAALLLVGPRYLGLLGARHRSALLVREAANLLDWTVDRACEGLFAPVGLDLGGDGAEAIALAILAEMQACVEGKLGTSRRMTPELIAEQIERGGASRYLQAQCAL